MDARAKRLRAILDDNQRATDRIRDVVAKTDGELRSLHDVMAPVQARTALLSNASANLATVENETNRWLDQLEATWAVGELARTGPEEDERAKDDFVRRVDALVGAERFFGERRAYRAAEGSWKHAGELVNECLTRCEEAFARELAAHDARARRLAKDAEGGGGGGPGDERGATSPSPPLQERGVGFVFPLPPPPIDTASFASSPKTPARMTEGGGGAAPSTPSSTLTSARKRAEAAARPELRAVTPFLKKLSRCALAAATARSASAHQVSGGKASIKDVRTAIRDAYVSARRAALGAALDREGLAALLRDGEAIAKPPPPRGGGVGLGASTTARTERWIGVLEHASVRWALEAPLAREVFGLDDDDDDDDDDRENENENENGGGERSMVAAAAAAVADDAVPRILEHSASTVLGWVNTLARQPSVGGSAGGPHGGGDDALARANVNRKSPEKTFALLRAHAALTRLRWGTESAFAPGGRAANAWRDALRTCEEGACVALGTLIPTIAAAAGRSDVEVRRLADGVVAFCAELLEHPNAADVLFGGDGSGGGDGRGGGGEMDGGSGGVHATPFTRGPVSPVAEEPTPGAEDDDDGDSDGILDFTDDDSNSNSNGDDGFVTSSESERDEEEEAAPAPAPAPATETAKSPPPPTPAAADAGNELGADLASFIVNALDAVTRGMDANACAPTSSSSSSSSAFKRSLSTSSASTSATATNASPALVALLRAVACDRVASAVEDAEELLRALPDGWLRAAREKVDEALAEHVDAGWGRAIRAMRGASAGDASAAAAMSDKERQAIKDRFTAVNAAVEDARRAWPGWNAPDGDVRAKLLARLRVDVADAYAAFYERYKDSGFARKNPKKYVTHSPEELREIVEALWTGGGGGGAFPGGGGGGGGGGAKLTRSRTVA